MGEWVSEWFWQSVRNMYIRDKNIEILNLIKKESLIIWWLVSIQIKAKIIKIIKKCDI